MISRPPLDLLGRMDHAGPHQMVDLEQNQCLRFHRTSNLRFQLLCMVIFAASSTLAHRVGNPAATPMPRRIRANSSSAATQVTSATTVPAILATSRKTQSTRSDSFGFEHLKTSGILGVNDSQERRMTSTKGNGGALLFFSCLGFFLVVSSFCCRLIGGKFFDRFKRRRNAFDHFANRRSIPREVFVHQGQDGSEPKSKGEANRKHMAVANLEFRRILSPSSRKDPSSKTEKEKTSRNPDVDSSEPNGVSKTKSSTKSKSEKPKPNKNKKKSKPCDTPGRSLELACTASDTESTSDDGDTDGDSRVSSLNRPKTSSGSVQSYLPSFRRHVGACVAQGDFCSICLEPYIVGDIVVRLKKNETEDTESSKEEADSRRCKHWFHKDCILEWLQTHDECPLCRVDMIHD